MKFNTKLGENNLNVILLYSYKKYNYNFKILKDEVAIWHIIKKGKQYI